MLLYDMALAPNPRRVRMFLAEKGITVPMRQVNIQAGENLLPDYLAVNPRGVVPTLVLDDGSIIEESLAICRYFDALHPDPPLFGTTPLEVAQVEQWQRRMEFDGMFQIAAAFRNSAPAYAKRSHPGTGPATAQIPALVERGLALASQWLDQLDARLEGREWLATDQFSVADITAFVCVDFAKWVKLRARPEQVSLIGWYERVKARPSASA